MFIISVIYITNKLNKRLKCAYEYFLLISVSSGFFMGIDYISKSALFPGKSREFIDSGQDDLRRTFLPSINATIITESFFIIILFSFSIAI
jgi:hypothetical protein